MVARDRSPYRQIELASKRLHEQIADKVQELITTRELEAGDKLPPQRELAQMLGVSRPTVREAMRLLQHRGLVTMKPGRGTHVSEMEARIVIESIERFSALKDCSFTDVMQVRELLEQGAAALAAIRATPKDIGILRQKVEAVERALEAQDYKAFVIADSQFHLTLVETCGNELLTAINASIAHLVTRWIRLSTRHPVDRQQVKAHSEILQAIAQQDADGARELTAAHIRRTQELYTTDAD